MLLSAYIGILDSSNMGLAHFYLGGIAFDIYKLY